MASEVLQGSLAWSLVTIRQVVEDHQEPTRSQKSRIHLVIYLICPSQP